MKECKYILILIAAVMAAVGCSKSDTPDTYELPYELSDTEIGFGAEESITKGTPVTAFSDGDSFGVYAIYTNGETQSTYMDNQEVSCYGTTWSYSPTMYWPVSGSLSFYAYSPYGASTTINQNESGEPILTYTVASNAMDQEDLLIANVEGATATASDTGVIFTFKHALSRIEVSFTNNLNDGNYTMRVTSVLLGNIMTTASVNMSTQSVTASDEGSVSALLSSGALEDKYVGYSETESLTKTDGGYFFIPPQTFDDDATIYVEIELYKVDTETSETSETPTSEYIAIKSLDGSISMGKSYAMEIEYGSSISDSGGSVSVSITEVWESVENDNDI